MKRERCTGAVVYAVVPYTREKEIDWEAFRRYIRFVADEGAQTIFVPGPSGEWQDVSWQERLALVKEAADLAGDRAMIVGTVVPEEMGAGEQAKAYLAQGADAINLRYPTHDVEAVSKALDEVSAAGAEYMIITDFKSGGFDMNAGPGKRGPAGLPDQVIVELFDRCEAFKSLVMALPLNECGPKSSRLKEATGGTLNIIAETATDQFLEHLDRGVEGFVTGAFVKVFERICALYAEGGANQVRPLFFEFLRAIVWTKQYIHREPYLYRLYLKERGVFDDIIFRTDRPIDEYMIRYGKEMLALVMEVEKKI